MNGWVDVKERSSVAFRLTERGGPDPIGELERVALVADEDRDGTSWIASRQRGVAFRVCADSRLLAFVREPGADVLALTASVVGRHDRLPPDALVRDMYEAYEGEFGAYWQIRNIRLRRVAFGDLPGTTLKGLRFSRDRTGQFATPSVRHHRRASDHGGTGGRATGIPLGRLFDDKGDEVGGMAFGVNEAGGGYQAIRHIAVDANEHDQAVVLMHHQDPNGSMSGLTLRDGEGRPRIVIEAASWLGRQVECLRFDVPARWNQTVGVAPWRRSA